MAWRTVVSHRIGFALSSSGSNGCEYMTNGIAAILGPVGHNFGAGMTGGMAFVYDSDESFAKNVNDDTVVYQRIQVPEWESLLRRMVEEHARETQSRFAERFLIHWNREIKKVWQVIPKEMIGRYEFPVFADEAEDAAERA